MTLGVGITTRNRRGIFNRSLRQWQRWAPPGTVLVVVDDASDKPVPDIDGVTVLRNEYRLGVGMSKNAAIAALMDAGCDHLFLADDDLHPLRNWWWRPYVHSPEPHLSYQGPRPRPVGIVGGDGEHYAVDFPRGFLLYVQREVVDAVGGMDPCFGAWGGEHVEWQARIHDAGLTTWAYADIRGSDALWHAVRAPSTVGGAERKRMLVANGLPWQKPRPRFVPYREGHHMQDWAKVPEIADTGQRWPLLRHLLDLAPAGTAVEFGTGNGDSTRIIAERMPVVTFDSFRGLPENWRPGYRKGSFAGAPPVIENATVVEGWFADTLPTFDFAALGYLGLVSIDCDLYSSTKTVLEYVGPYLRPGVLLYFDEIFDYPGHEGHELKAWQEFAEDTKIGWTVVGYGPEQAWAIRIT